MAMAGTKGYQSAYKHKQSTGDAKQNLKVDESWLEVNPESTVAWTAIDFIIPLFVVIFATKAR
jgi:transposase-like protein